MALEKAWLVLNHDTIHDALAMIGDGTDNNEAKADG